VTLFAVDGKGSSRLGLFTCDVTSGCYTATLTTTLTGIMEKMLMTWEKRYWGKCMDQQREWTVEN